MATTETIDKLYLELAQFTQAESGRETELLGCIRGIGRAIGCNHTEDADGRQRLVRCAEERMREQGVSQLIEERDAAEEALSQAFYLITGRSPEWSNLFGHKEALEEIDAAQRALRDAAKLAQKD
jgi:hypothetical protein